MIEIKSIPENRAAFIKALINEPQDAQCNASLFGGSFEGYGLAADGKEMRCALGVAATLFFGIDNYEDAEAFDEDPASEGLYSRLSDVLGLASASDVWSLNDDEKLPFVEIASALSEDWGIPA